MISREFEGPDGQQYRVTRSHWVGRWKIERWNTRCSLAWEVNLKNAAILILQCRKPGQITGLSVMNLLIGV